MRICLIGNARAPHLQRWAMAYRDAGHPVEIISIRSASIPGIPVHTVSLGRVNDPSSTWSLLSYARLAAAARGIVARCNPDVVNAHFVSTSGTIARIAGSNPVVITAWGSDIIPADGVAQSRTLRTINRMALAKADRVTVASHYLAGWVRTLAPDAEVTVVPFGVDTEMFHPPEIPAVPGGLSIGLVKSLEQRYGIEYAIRAMPAILAHRSDARLTIVGEGSLRQNLESLTASLGVEEAVDFLGRVEHGYIPELMRTFDVLLNMTIVPESFGVVILEGSATGIPVVSTDVGGIREVCIDGVTACLVPPQDPVAVAAAVVDLASDPDARSHMGIAGREFVRRTFEWNDSVAAMLEVLRSVAAVS